jgi:hypothetical protein
MSMTSLSTSLRAAVGSSRRAGLTPAPGRTDGLRTRKAQLLDHAIPRAGPPCSDIGLLSPGGDSDHPSSRPCKVVMGDPTVMSSAPAKGLTRAREGSGLKLRSLSNQPRAWNGSMSCSARSSRTGPAESSCSTGIGRLSRPVRPTPSLRQGKVAQPARTSQIVSTTPRLTR